VGTRSIPGVKRPGRGVDHPPSYSADVEGRVKLYNYSNSGSLPLHVATYVQCHHQARSARGQLPCEISYFFWKICDCVCVEIKFLLKF
jgi:hypothetical protein